MRRAFLIQAAIAGFLLVWSLVLDLIGSPNRLVWFSVAATLLVHGTVVGYLWATGRKVDAVADRQGWPDWVGAQAEKNRRKAIVALGWCSMLVVLTAGTSGGDWWQLVLSAVCLSFQLGSFVGEVVILAAQSRLLGDLKSWANRRQLASDL